MDDGKSSPLLDRTRKLVNALIISGALNIGLISTFVYFAFREKYEAVTFDLKPVDPSNAEISSRPTCEKILKAYSQIPYQELLLKLENKEHVENGFNRRDLALACLVAFHHFNLDKALGGLPLQQRISSFMNPQGEERVDLPVYIGVTDYQFQAIANFAKTERWPFTSQGLFYELKRSPNPKEPSLSEAFLLTSEFHMAAVLFTRSGVHVPRAMLLEMLAQGEWTFLENFVKEEKQAQDFSLEKRRTFLMHYLQCRSPIAAKLLLETDLEHTTKNLDDAQVLVVLELIKEKSPSLETFAKTLLISPRADFVRYRAGMKLYHLAEEVAPEPFDHQMALRRFAPEALEERAPQQILAQVKPALKAVAEIEKKGTKRTHIVQQGDSLWKIARKYRVPMDALMKINNLETDRLRQGKTLQIPDPAN
jgi:hypothetical protein